MASINELDEDSNISVTLSVSDINDSLETVSPVSPTDTAESSSSSQARLLLLDGTFFKYLPEKCTGNKITALCMKCPRDVLTKVKGFHNCTSNFLSHLKRKHGQDCIEEYKTYVKKKKSEVKKKGDTFVKITTSKTKRSNEKIMSQEQFDENILKYFIHSMIPLHAVEDPYFSKIFTDLNISEMGLILMSRRTLGRRIEKHYETQVAKIKSELEKVPYVCTTIDIWTAHWITNDLRRVSVALDCQRFRGVHSYDRLSDIIQEINGEFDLNTNKIVASVTDNGSNFVKAFKTFGVKLTNINIENEVMPDSQPTEASSESDVEEGESWNLDNPEHICFLPVHLRCCAHFLSLCATTDANKVLTEQDTPLSQMHAAIMKKCNVLWKAAGRPKSAETIQDVLGHTLSRPGETRWNSLFDALQQIFNMKEKSLLLHRSLNMKILLK
ncbi:unnamed protein product, partial [Brenthis ino]